MRETYSYFSLCFAGLLDVARRTYTELVDDVAGTSCYIAHLQIYRVFPSISQLVTVDAE